MPGDTIQSFAARFNVTPQEVVCYANQMRNINNEFSSYWVLGAMVLVPCASANPENVTCPEWQLMTGALLLVNGWRICTIPAQPMYIQYTFQQHMLTGHTRVDRAHTC